MIIARSPLRISIGGGGTDLKSYYQENEGFFISAAITKYVYVTITRPFEEGVYLKYSSIEKTKSVSKIQHRIIRETLKDFKLKTPQVEITTLADIPSGTGLGSSGSFTTALIKALSAHYNKHMDQKQLAEFACKIEIDKLGEPIGKQDQYIAAIGGLTEFKIAKNGKVTYQPLKMKFEDKEFLEDHLMLFFTGYSRSASKILKDQDRKTKSNNFNMIRNLNFIKDIGLKSKNALLKGNFNEFSKLMNVHWEYKLNRSKTISNLNINKWIKYGLKNGAAGGKLVGAGGGGFLMFFANDKNKLRSAMKKIKLNEVKFNFDNQGTNIILNN